MRRDCPPSERPSSGFERHSRSPARSTEAGADGGRYADSDDLALIKEAAARRGNGEAEIIRESGRALPRARGADPDRTLPGAGDRVLRLLGVGVDTRGRPPGDDSATATPPPIPQGPTHARRVPPPPASPGPSAG